MPLLRFSALFINSFHMSASAGRLSISAYTSPCQPHVPSPKTFRIFSRRPRKSAKDHCFTGIICLLLQYIFLDSQQKVNGTDLEFYKASE